MPTPPTNAGKRFSAEPLTSDEVRQLIAAAPTRSSSGIRARAIIGVLYGSGLRISEALSLRPKDYDPRAGTVRVLRGKGDKDATVGIDRHGGALLDGWLDHRRGLGATGRHPIFCTYTRGNVGAPLDQRYVREMIKKMGERAGIDKRVHPHGLRHSLAFDLAQRGVPMHVIQAQLRHTSLAVTDRYIRHLSPTDVLDVMRDREW
jgi:site-specific recombinase XerD